MKKLTAQLLLVSILFFFSFSSCAAQDFGFERAYSDYLHNLNLYRTAHLDYVSAKSEYQAYKTLTAQDKALEKTRQMLEKRNDVLSAYLTALRIKLAQTTKIINYEQNMRYLFLDDQIAFLKTSSEKLSLSGSLEDLMTTSSELEKRYPEIEALAYKTLGTIADDQVSQVQKELEEQTNKIEEIIGGMRKAGEEISTLEQWLAQVKAKITQAQGKKQEGKNIIDNLKGNTVSKEDSFFAAQKKFEEANLYLKEAVLNLKETLKKIKYG